MTITVTLTYDDPKALLADMAALAGLATTAVSFVPSDNVRAVGLVEAANVQVEPLTPKRGRKSKDAPVTGPQELPAAPVQEAFSIAQQDLDAADEKADSEANKNADKSLTVDDVRNAVGGYVKKFTMEAAQVDLQVVFKAATGDKFDRMSQLKDADQPTLKAIVDAVDKATADDKRYGTPT